MDSQFKKVFRELTMVKCHLNNLLKNTETKTILGSYTTYDDILATKKIVEATQNYWKNYYKNVYKANKHTKSELRQQESTN